MSGFAGKPRPRGLLSLSGYGDITRTWYTRPSPFYLQQPAIPKEEAYQGLGGDGCLSKLGEEDKRRARFYFYCRQKGIWPEEVTGHDPDINPRWFDPYCPARNVSANYPPTVLIHGTADTDVPFDESVNMEEQLSRFKTNHFFLPVADGSHCLWKDPPDVKAAVFKKAMDFVAMQLS
jgi:pimeloyl-ACP methyl ester carboxylesterase